MKHPESGQPRGTFFRGLLLGCVLATAVFALPSLASAQAPAEPTPPPPDTSTSTQAPTTGGTQQTQPADTPQQPQTSGQPAQGAQPNSTASTPKETPPIPQQDNPKVKAGSEADVDAVGNRGVGKGVNFYSLEKEIALGKGLAQEVERSSKLIDDPVVSEYVNRVGQNLVRNSDAKVPFSDQGDRFGPDQRIRAAGWFLLREQRSHPGGRL